jgi:hypothetical protein
VIGGGGFFYDPYPYPYRSLHTPSAYLQHIAPAAAVAEAAAKTAHLAVQP